MCRCELVCVWLFGVVMCFGVVCVVVVLFLGVCVCFCLLFVLGFCSGAPSVAGLFLGSARASRFVFGGVVVVCGGCVLVYVFGRLWWVVGGVLVW